MAKCLGAFVFVANQRSINWTLTHQRLATEPQAGARKKKTEFSLTQIG